MKRFIFRLSIALLTFLIGIVLTLSVYTFRRSSRSEQKSSPAPNTQWAEYGTLMWNVQMAKARGKKEYVTSSLGCGMGVSNLNEALSEYTIVIARPVEKKTFMNTFGLDTWYRFKVIETLSVKPLRGFHRESLANMKVPADLLPLNADEFLIPGSGGTLDVEGVRVTEYSNSPKFSLSNQYVLFLNLNSDKQVAFIPWSDEVGIFTIDANGLLKATDNNSYDLKEKMASRFDNSVEQLKSYLEHRAEAKRR